VRLGVGKGRKKCSEYFSQNAHFNDFSEFCVHLSFIMPLKI